MKWTDCGRIHRRTLSGKRRPASPLGLQRPRHCRGTAIDVEPLLHSVSDGLVDCHYPMPLASRRARPSHVFCLYAFQSLTVRRFRGGRKMGSDPSSDRLPCRLAVAMLPSQALMRSRKEMPDPSLFSDNVFCEDFRHLATVGLDGEVRLVDRHNGGIRLESSRPSGARRHGPSQGRSQGPRCMPIGTENAPTLDHTSAPGAAKQRMPTRPQTTALEKLCRSSGRQ